MNLIRKDIAIRYNHFSVDRNIKKEPLLDLVLSEFTGYKCYKYETNMSVVNIYYGFNEWESKYFGINSITLYFIDFNTNKFSIIYEAIQSLITELNECFNRSLIITFEVPSEDNKLIQLLNLLGFRSVETRLHLLNNDLNNFNFKHFSTRNANMQDISNLKRVASLMRNIYDRFHSDLSFDKGKADDYLSTYIENSINGFADIVIVPDEIGLPSDSFLTANIYKQYWDKFDYPISKMVLSAVSSETNKGWYIKLITEMTYRLKEMGAKSIFATTQSTNIPVLVTWEKLGYRIGRTTHVLTYNSKMVEKLNEY